jgi:predicted RNA-binding protein with PUA-like domain
MAKGDAVLIYHTGSVRAVVGLARATSGAYPDPRLKDPKRLVADLAADRRLRRAVTLDEIKKDARFKSFELLRIGRLSVMPVPARLWKGLMALSEKPAP